MLDITGARTQPPMRSHWKLRPGPQSYLLCNSKQLSKRYKRGKQHKQHSSHRPPHPEPLSEHMVRRVVIRGMALTSPVTARPATVARSALALRGGGGGEERRHFTMRAPPPKHPASGHRR